MAELKELPKTNIFANAKVINEPKKEEKPKSNGKREVDLGEALDVSAAIDALTNTLASVKETIDVEIKEKMVEEFVDEAIKIKRKPESFKGVSEQASASCEIRKRSSRSVLRDEEVEVLKKNGISIETKVIKEEVPQHYVINPKALKDPKLVTEISNRLEGLTTADGEGIIMLQEGREAEVAQIVSSNVLNEVSKKIKNKNTLKKIFEIVSVNALGKFKLTDPSLSNIFAILVEAGVEIK